MTIRTGQYKPFKSPSAERKRISKSLSNPYVHVTLAMFGSPTSWDFTTNKQAMLRPYKSGKYWYHIGMLYQDNLASIYFHSHSFKNRNVTLLSFINTIEREGRLP